MKKKRSLTVLIISFLLFLPLIRISTAQGPYVGIEEDDVFLLELSVYNANWGTYFSDNLEDTLDNLFPLGPEYNLTLIYNQLADYITRWPITVTDIGAEETGELLSIYGDNTTITYTPVNGTLGYFLVAFPTISDSWDMPWAIVNDTSSFLRQTLNLTLAFSAYSIMGIPFVPTDISWTSFVTEFLSVMSFKGGLYNNISATAQSNGYSLNVPALGFENNSEAIDIDVTYDSNGYLTYYEFSYGGQMLVTLTLVEPYDPVITNSPDNFTIETGYVGESISWTATDLNPDTYTIVLEGSGTAAGPLAWQSGVPITYYIPVGYAAGNYTYIITFTDKYGNYATDSVVITIIEAETSPTTEEIPGYDLSIIIGISAVALISLVALMKKKKK
ncbi:MAG: hypothetical protein ACFFFT_15015 [Candidatus Thorarchaeota archaeon]